MPEDTTPPPASLRWRDLGVPVVVALVAFGLRIAWIAYANFTPTVSDDAGRYDLLARSLADNAGFINPNGTTTMFWPPGYPFLLATVYKLWPQSLFGDHQTTAALVLNAALASISVVLVYLIGRRAFDHRVAIAAAVITALFPSLIFFAGVTLTETTFTFLALVAVLLILEADARRSWWLLAAAGLVVGCAALVRGQALLLPVVALPFWLRSVGAWRPAVARTAITGALALAVIVPWTARNYNVSGSLVLISSNAGVDFYIGHSSGADGRGRIVDDLVFRYPQRRQAEAEAQINRDGFREGIAYALKHPLGEGGLAVRKFFWLYWRDDEALKWNEAHGERPFLSDAGRLALGALSNLYYWGMLVLAALGTRRWFSLRDPARLLLVCLAAYWTLVHVAFFADPRFHAPIVPVLALWAGCGVAEIISRARGGDRSAAASATVASHA